jgi:hypothetical protein
MGNLFSNSRWLSDSATAHGTDSLFGLTATG